jgi:hypothetical protein
VFEGFKAFFFRVKKKAIFDEEPAGRENKPASDKAFLCQGIFC